MLEDRVALETLAGLIAFGRQAAERGWVPATSGNFRSVRGTACAW